MRHNILSYNTAKVIDEIEKTGSKIIRKIMSPKYENRVWKMRSIKDICNKRDIIVSTMLKRRAFKENE